MAGCLRTHRFLSLFLVFDARRIPPRRAGACNTLKEPAGGLWGILNKLKEPVVSPLQILLGLLVNTREMTVSVLDEFRRVVLALLTATWHCRRESFTVKELELLVGKLGRIAQAYCPFYFFMSHLYSSLAFALRKNRAFIINTSKRFRALIKKTKQDGIHCVATDEREINFALSQSAKKVHSCPTKYRILPSL